MHEELVNLLLCDSGWLEQGFTQTERDIAEHLKKAADAIEELSREYESIAKSLTESVELVRKLQSPRWVSVTERLPNMHEGVLVCNEDYGETGLGFSEVAVWDGSDWICAWDMESRLHFITHWMPLPPAPEPPKEAV